MTQTSVPWAGASVGDAGSYSDAIWSNIWRELFTSDPTVQGVLAGYANELNCTGAASPVTVDTGAGICDGKFFRSTATENLTLSSPHATLTIIDRVVLRKSWAAQTVRLAVVSGTAGAGVPALTQTDGVTWEIPLWQCSIAAVTGAVTLTDERYYIRTPMGPRTLTAYLAVTDLSHTAAQWNTISMAGGTTTLTPGTWLVHGVMNVKCGTAGGRLRARIYNTTSSAVVSQGSITLGAGEYGMIPLSPAALNYSGDNDLVLQLYPANTDDQVLGIDSAGETTGFVAQLVWS